MRYSLLFFLIFFCSCQFFEKKIDTQTIIENELKTFKWDELDQYPSFEVCDDIIKFELNKNCFESTIINHFTDFIKNNDSIRFSKTNDTLILDLSISKTGKLKISSSQIQQSSDSSVLFFIKSVQESLIKLPPLYPAVKRGQYVDSRFKLPVILNTNQ